MKNVMLILIASFMVSCTHLATHQSVPDQKEKNLIPSMESVMKKRTDLNHLLELFDSRPDNEFAAPYLWGDYITSLYKHQNSELIQTIKKLCDDYIHAEKRTNTLRFLKDRENKVSNKWCSDLSKKFGKEYITNHLDEIKNTVFAIYLEKDGKRKREAIKETLYKEIKYKNAVEEYLNSFITFYQTLNENNKKAYSRQFKAANQFFNDYSQSALMSSALIGNLDFETTIHTAKANNQNLYDFLYHHPSLKDEINMIVMNEALEEVAESYKKSLNEAKSR